MWLQVAVCHKALLLISDAWRQKLLATFSEKPENTDASYSDSGFQGQVRRKSERGLGI